MLGRPGKRTSFRAAGLAVVFACALLGSAFVASAGAAIVLRDGVSFKKLAAFNALNCSDSPKKGFTGTASDAGWKLQVTIKPFPKYKTYFLFYRKGSPAKFTVSKGDVTYSSSYSPKSDPLHELKGGVLSFPGGPDKIGISFGTAFNPQDELQYAGLGGLAQCN